MTVDEKYTVAHLSELSKRSESRCIWTYSEFLTTAEQDAVHKSAVGSYTLFGGFEGAERRIAVFGSEELCGYAYKIPIKTLKITPASKKFSDELTHRDYLGALMSMGIKRNTIGDIIVQDDGAYLFCLEGITEFIRENLFQIKHTTVKCDMTDEVPEFACCAEPEELLTASERLDGIIAAVYKIPRSKSKTLVEQGKVFINSILCTSPSTEIDEDSIISVRGRGRFKYLGISRQTKKGKLSVKVICQR